MTLKHLIFICAAFLIVVPLSCAHGATNEAKPPVAATEPVVPQKTASQTASDRMQLPDLSYLAAKVGVTPALGKKYESTWDDPVLKKAVEVNLGKEVADKIYTVWAKDGFVEHAGFYRKGNIIYTEVGRKHDVGHHRLMIFINLGTSASDPFANTMQACLRETRARKQYAYILATGRAAKELLPSTGSLGLITPDDPDGLQFLRKNGVLRWDIPAVK